MQLTVRVDGLAVRRTDAEHASDENVLETRQQEQRGILIIECLKLVAVDVGRSVPDASAL